MEKITEGIVLKQVKTVKGLRMVTVFTKDLGKIQAGTTMSEYQRGKAALTLRPFSYGTYHINSKNGYHFLNKAESIKYYYNLCQDMDKYAYGAYVLEFSNKYLEEEVPLPEYLNLLLDYLTLLEGRKKDFDMLHTAFQIKALSMAGTMPIVTHCVSCSKKENLNTFSVKDGGTLCDSCKDIKDSNEPGSLIYHINLGIINAITFLGKTDITALEKLKLDSNILEPLKSIINDYLKYHLDMGDLLSERCFMIT